MSEQEIKLNDQTFEEWVKHIFEFEYCSDCGGDWYDHEPNILLGNWFARCKIAADPNYKVRLKEPICETCNLGYCHDPTTTHKVCCEDQENCRCDCKLDEKH